jgi:hypothetical protein
MTPSPLATALLEVLAGQAESLPGSSARSSGSMTTWSLGAMTFAVVDGGTIELRLDPPVAAAALKTPDTAASQRGPEWVRYAPRTLEGHDLDRLTAWFALAHRRAGQQAGRASR